MNDNSLKELLTLVKPKIRSIEEHRIECSSLKSVFETIQELVELGEKSYKEILSFYDQEFILRAIKIGNSNAKKLIEKYESSKYLLQSDDDKLAELPQVKDSIVFMEQLYKYLSGLYEKIKLDYESKSEKLIVEELLNKYYHLLNKENVFIKDIDEFLEFLDLNELDIRSRLNILIAINKSNIKNYVTTNDIDIGNKVNLSKITKLLNNNKDLITNDYNQEVGNLSLGEYLQNNINDLENSLNLRKIYLINKINELYQNKKYNEIIKLYKEYDEVEKLEIEFDKQNKGSTKIVFLLKNNKSLVRDYLEKTSSKYKGCVLKNLLDLETKGDLDLPKMCYNNQYIYVKDDFVVKTVYTYIDKYILVLGVLDVKEKLDDFIKKNEYLLAEVLDNQDKIKFNEQERNLILKDIKLEDLVLSIDLDTLDVKVEE